MKFYDAIPENLRDWSLKQKVFFTASAPLTGKHVNVSPKGLPNATFSIFDPNHAAYIDATGSGSETIAHIYENRRVTIMFCSFDKLPRILRFFCWGSVIELDSPEFEPMLTKMGKGRPDGARAIIMLDVWKVSTSCGTGVPCIGPKQTLEEEMENDDSAEDGKEIETYADEYIQDRESMNHWAQFMQKNDKMDEWRKTYNADSLDGLTGMKSARKAQGQCLWWKDLQVAARRIMTQKEAVVTGLIAGMAWMLLLNIIASLR